jgi:hypothetical protein
VRADGAGAVEILHRTHATTFEAVMSPDAKWIVYRTQPSDIFGVRLDGDRKPIPLVEGRASDRMPRISPDGKWLLYESDVSGVVEVYVQPFPGPGPRTQLSAGGGYEPLWSRSGREVFYRQPGRVMAVAVSGDARITVGARRVAALGSYVEDPGRNHPDYDVAPDGKHLLMVKLAGTGQRLVLVHNWARELRPKLSAK